MSTIGIKELLEAGVHFGHQTRRWNPKMKRFIFEARNGIHVIDLSKTVVQLEEACKFLAATAAKGGNILFVGTKKQAQEAVKESAKACGQPFVTERWLGGTLTNLKTVKRSMKRMKEIERMEQDGSINQYVKQEQSMIRREHQRLFKNLDGLRAIDAAPDVMFVIDLKREHNAVAEARRLRIPLVAIVDTNADPDLRRHQRRSRSRRLPDRRQRRRHPVHQDPPAGRHRGRHPRQGRGRRPEEPPHQPRRAAGRPRRPRRSCGVRPGRVRPGRRLIRNPSPERAGAGNAPARFHEPHHPQNDTLHA